MSEYTPTNTPKRPAQLLVGGVQGAPDFVTRKQNTGYEWNNNFSLPHQMVDNNWIALDTMAQGGRHWPLYTGLYLKNRGLDTEGGVFVDNPYNNGGVTRFGVNYVNYRIPLEDSSFGVTLVQGDFLSHNGDLYLKNGQIKYGTKVTLIDSALDSAMTLTGNDIFVGKGSATNPNSSQFRIGKLGGTQVEVGSLNNILNQEVVLQVGAAGATTGTSASGFIKAKQIVVSPPQWNMSLHSYNGATDVEALTIAPDGQVSIPDLVGAGPDYDSAKITNLTAPGIVQLGTYNAGAGGNAPPGVGTTVVWGDLDVRGSITFPGSGTGVENVNITSTTPSPGLIVDQNQNSGIVNINVSVAALNKIPLATEVTSWNALLGSAGAAARADTLTTPRLIWGQAFDGTADVSGALTNVTSVTASGVPLELISNNQVKLQANLAEYRFKSTSTPYGILKFNTLDADRTYTMPNNSGTVALLSDVVSGGIQLNVANEFTAMQTFSAGITGELTGNAATATTATDAEALDGDTASITDNAKIVLRDASGNFTAGTISAALNGNALTCDTATNSEELQGFTSGTTNQGNTIVRRDINGNFSAGTITASLIGNATSVTDGVYLSGTQTINGTKTFSSTISGSINGNATTATNSSKLQGYVSTNANTVDTIVRRSPSGNFAAGVVTVTELRSTGDVIAYHSSDRRLKDNITPIKNALEKVISLSGNTFDWNDKSDKEGSDTGVIAQEVEVLGLPSVVTERETGYLAVRYEKLVPLLIEAIKELKIEVEELKS